MIKYAFLLAISLVPFLAGAVVACPEPAVVFQPDGSSLTLLLHGDEWFNYSTTADGYTVVRDSADGYYKYAILEDNMLVPSTMVAHDSQRSPQEVAWLGNTAKYLTPDASSIFSLRARKRLHGNNGHYDYKNFRGLVILVQYNDCPFVYDDPHTLFNDMINQKDYKGFMSNAMFPELIPYTGSVRDYFYASSAGEFDPVFDVVGPVTIDYSMYDASKSANAQALVTAALNAADSLVNYKDYDRDGNLTVDMVFFLFSGPGSNFSGNDSRLLWPHASSILSKSLDGVSFGRYACSTELYGRPESQIIDGIGTICHEFSHVLGIADLYDTDGTGSGGSSVTPGRWTLMAQGSYLNQSRTPCAYSTYERYAAGFITPDKLTAKGNYTLAPVTKANKGYRLDTPVDGEYFLLETRAKTGWDAYLPGEGMLVWRVDSTDVNVWENNKVNCNPAHNYYQLVRATGGTTDSGADPFPGTGGITFIDNNTTPNLRTWTGVNGLFGLSDIARNSDGSVSFNLSVTKFENLVEDFEDMDLSDANATVEGKYTTWTLKGGAKIAQTGETNAGNGAHACYMMRSAEIISDTLPCEVQSFKFDFYNPTTSSTIVRTYYRTSPTGTWVALKNDDGLESVSVAANTMSTITFSSILPEGVQLRIVEYTGSRTAPCYVDDITVTVVDEDEKVFGDLNGDGVVDIADVNMVIDYILNGGTAPDDLNGDGQVDIVDVNVLLDIILSN